MATSSRPSSPLLPAFSIRDLNGPREPPGVVQITASQYDGTLHSQPDAALSYVDLDDGELITVGTAFELRQRLDEPVSTSTRAVHPVVVGSFTVRSGREGHENKMHIFDIRHSSGSLAVWRDHEAYSSKTLRKPDSSPSFSRSRSSSPYAAASSDSAALSTTNTSITQHSQSKVSVPQPLSSLSTDFVATKASVDKPRKTQQTSPTQEETPALPEMPFSDIFATFEPHLGPLADFLESTADGLRKLAEKTAEADTSPVENVLGGFKNIVKEVGEMTLDFLAGIGEELERNRTSASGIATEVQIAPASKQAPHMPAGKPEEPKAEDKPYPATESSGKRVSFFDTALPVPASTKPEPTVRLPLNREDLVPQPRNVPEHRTVIPPPLALPSTIQTRDATFRYPLPPPTAHAFVPMPRPTVHFPPSKNSIIDSQPADADVLTRYPPLPSLRKAASVSGLHGNPEPSTRYQPGFSTTSALFRYPSIGQFEEQSRLRSKNSPDAKLDNTPGSDPTCYSQPGKSKKEAFHKKHAVENVNCNPNNDQLAPLALRSDQDWPSQPRSPKKTDIYKKPTVEDADDEAPKDQPATSTIKPKDASRREPRKSTAWTLPGAWPEPPSDVWHSTMPTTMATTVKASGANTSAVTTSTREQLPGDLSHRVSSPVSETYSRGPLFPRKSQTISGTNPAARLNGPFDPLAHIPVLQPRPQRSQPDLSGHQFHPSSDQKETPVIPGAFPKRSQTVHHTDRYRPRYVAPYPYSTPTLWESYLQKNHSTNTLPRVPVPGPWQFSHDASRRHPVGSHGPSLRDSDYPVARPPTFGTMRAVQPVRGSRPEAGRSMQPLPIRPAPPAPKPQWVSFPTQPETPKAEPVTVKPATTVSPVVTNPIQAAAQVPMILSASNLSRASSILSPCPPAFTQPRGRSGTSPPAPMASKGVDDCVRTLKAMGFGSDPNELARLNVYAGAAAGDVEAAIEMIEEDREAARELEMSSQVSQAGSERNLERDFGAEESFWEDY